MSEFVDSTYGDALGQAGMDAGSSAQAMDARSSAKTNDTPGNDIERRFPELSNIEGAELGDQVQTFTSVLKKLQQELDDASH
ncbi:MAG: hypothetical protein ABF747_09500 [Bifidobacterium sp.]|uniref:Uncharacterized protein n=1 Tax=Bifidobacterium fermentum TaxID=3059035 RepID=A0AB39UGT4_9BIFI